MTVATYGSTLRTAVVEGLEFAYHEEGEGEPLIMLHGSGPGVSAWSNFQHNMPAFAGRFRTIMPDMPGFGSTALPDLDDAHGRCLGHRPLAAADESA